jgi:hypothetical protein
MNVRPRNTQFVKFFGAYHSGSINDSEIDEGGPTDSKKCRSEKARPRVVKIEQNQIEEETNEER